MVKKMTKNTSAHRYHPLRRQLYSDARQTWMREFEISSKRRMRHLADLGVPYQNAFDIMKLETPNFFGLNPDDLETFNMFQNTVERNYDNFSRSGKIIFDCSAIAEAFSKTDIHGISMDDLHPPFPFFYLHIGRSAGLVFDNGNHVEGCYVMAGKDENGEKTICLVFHAYHIGFETMRERSHAEMYIAFTTIGRVVLHGSMPFTDIDLNDESGCSDGAHEFEKPGLLDRCVAIAVNFMIYLQMKETDVEKTFSEGAPPELAQRALTHPKSMRKLESMGFAHIRFVGRKLAVKMGLNGDQWSGTVRPHWRRGHIRHVAVGSGRLGREIRLIKPVIVNHRLGTPDETRIYSMPEMTIQETTISEARET
jgi:hypothetical protein